MSRRDRQRRRRRNRRSPLGRIIALGGVLVLCVAAVGALAVVGWVVNVARSAPNLSSVKPSTPGSPTEVFSSDGTPLGYIRSKNIQTTVAGPDLPHVLKHATVAIEDRRFFHHGALDYEGILRAALKDAVNGKTALQGASTLTQQLVDNKYLPKKYREQREKRTLKYKIVQAKLAEQLEAKHSKEWILDDYLNSVPYGTVGGETAYGVGAASRMFFDKPVEKLDLAQAAMLAGMPQAPSEYNPFLYPKAAKHRRAEVLQAMVTAGDIGQRTADRTARKPLEVHESKLYRTRVDPYVFDFIEGQLEGDLCPKTPNKCPELEKGGLKVYTSINLKDQAAATAAIDAEKPTLAEQGGYAGSAGAGLASVDAQTGHILAIATSGHYSQTKVNYATSAYRQTGSAFKVFALMELIHDYNGNPDETYYTSRPLAAGWLPEDPTWDVHTDTDTYNGTINITEATAISDNTVFAQLSADMGNIEPGDKLDQIAHAMGITSPLDGNPSEVLGGLRKGVTPLQMADAYATIANGGTHIPETIIDKVQFADGSTRDFGAPKKTTVFPYNQTYAADEVLKGVLTKTGATGTGAYYGCPAAGKTGTANNLANAWFVGYTPKVSTAVWVGYPEGNYPMADGFGGILAAPIWKQYMEDTDGGYCGDWTAPSDPFTGVPYIGAHSASGSSDYNYGTGTSTYGETSTTGSTTGTTGNTGTAANTGATGNTGAATGNTGAATGNTGATGTGAPAGNTGQSGGGGLTGN
jgi:penicillin-binding protein 1A